MRLALSFLLLFSAGKLLAQGSQCLSGSSGNRTFINSLQTSPTPLVTRFRVEEGIRSTEGQAGGCPNGSCSGHTSGLKRLPNTLSEIPKECIQASLKRKVAQTSIECRRKQDGNWDYATHSARSKSTPCIDDSVVNYTHYVTNKVLSCFQGLNLKNGVKESVDTKLFYAKINNESGFNFSFSYKGGTGIGQLTSWAVREMNVINAKGTPGGGRYVLDALLNSPKQECQDIKHIIADDQRFRYQNPREPQRTCEWVSMETGMAKGLIYSLAYSAHLKNEIIGPQLQRIAPHLANDPEILNLLAMVGYGPGGTNRARTLIYTLRMNERSTSLESIKSRLRSEQYVKATFNKLNEIKRMPGASCQLF